ncbi:MAG TPA: hypothetical protein VNS49_05675 [Streptomyces sp.]|nr:hypothetical protein [Streptomyces sp.]
MEASNWPALLVESPQRKPGEDHRRIVKKRFDPHHYVEVSGVRLVAVVSNRLVVLDASLVPDLSPKALMIVRVMPVLTASRATASTALSVRVIRPWATVVGACGSRATRTLTTSPTTMGTGNRKPRTAQQVSVNGRGS